MSHEHDVVDFEFEFSAAQFLLDGQQVAENAVANADEGAVGSETRVGHLRRSRRRRRG